LVSVTNYAQIKGTVSDDKGNPLPFVTVFQEDTYNGTTSMRWVNTIKKKLKNKPLSFSFRIQKQK
jgi:hypothetical protein